MLQSDLVRRLPNTYVLTQPSPVLPDGMPLELVELIARALPMPEAVDVRPQAKADTLKTIFKKLDLASWELLQLLKQSRMWPFWLTNEWWRTKGACLGLERSAQLELLRHAWERMTAPLTGAFLASLLYKRLASAEGAEVAAAAVPSSLGTALDSLISDL